MVIFWLCLSSWVLVVILFIVSCVGIMVVEENCVGWVLGFFEVWLCGIVIFWSIWVGVDLFVGFEMCGMFFVVCGFMEIRISRSVVLVVLLELLWFEWLVLVGLFVFVVWLLGGCGVLGLLLCLDLIGIMFVIFVVFFVVMLWCGVWVWLL